MMDFAHTFKTLKSEEWENSRKGQKFKPFNFIGHGHDEHLPRGLVLQNDIHITNTCIVLVQPISHLFVTMQGVKA